MFRAVRWAVALAAVTLLTQACDDQRGPVSPVSTGLLQGDSVFDIASFVTTAYTGLNDVAGEILLAHESGTPTPITLNGCGGGTALITDNADGNPNTYRVTFSLYTTGCRDFLPLLFATDPDVDGAMIMTIGETSPGLSYTLDFPYDLAANLPAGITIQLPSEIGLDFGFTTPFGPITYTLDQDRGVADAQLQMRGTLRWEDRANGFNMVQELALAYPVDETESPIVTKYPIGAYQISLWAGGVTGLPVNVGFLGEGVVVYYVDGTNCRGNLALNINPCEDL